MLFLGKPLNGDLLERQGATNLIDVVVNIRTDFLIAAIWGDENASLSFTLRRHMRGWR